MKWKNEKIKII